MVKRSKPSQFTFSSTPTRNMSEALSIKASALGASPIIAIEYRNKDRRKARLKFSRKKSWVNTITDMYHYLIKMSAPIVNSI